MTRPRTHAALLSVLTLVLASCAETPSAGLTGPRVPAAGTATAESRRPHACIVQDGELRNVEVRIDPATGDTLTVDGRPFAKVYATLAKGYAARQAWYVNGEEIILNGLPYYKYLLPRTVTPEMATGDRPVLVRIGEFRGVGLFAEPDQLKPLVMDFGGGRGGRSHIIYVQVGPGCNFQPYNHDVQFRRVP